MKLGRICSIFCLHYLYYSRLISLKMLEVITSHLSPWQTKELLVLKVYLKILGNVDQDDQQHDKMYTQLLSISKRCKLHDLYCTKLCG